MAKTKKFQHSLSNAKPSGKKKFDVHRALPSSHYRPPATTGEPQPEKKTGKERSLWKRLLVALVLLLLTLIIFIGAWDAVNISRASRTIFGSGNLFSLVSDNDARSRNDRTNILLVGYSVDDPGHPGAKLTDSIILLSMNAKTHSGYMLSIPRDLYVKIPGFGYAKINEAYSDGGIDLLEQIVEQDFNVPIDYYALVNYAAVHDTVNALGGVTLNIMSSDPRGLYDTNISPVDGGPLQLANGAQKLDGRLALNLTRARGDAYGSYGFPQADFDRTEHQRQVLAAIKEELSWTLILNPLKNGKLFQAVSKNVKTDISLGEARSVFTIFNSIPTAQLRSISLRSINGQNLLASYVTGSGQSALIPAAGLDNYSQIQMSITGL